MKRRNRNWAAAPLNISAVLLIASMLLSIVSCSKKAERVREVISADTPFYESKITKLNCGFDRQHTVLYPFLQFRYQVVEPEITIYLFSVHSALFGNRIDNCFLAHFLHQVKILCIGTGIDDRRVFIVAVCVGGNKNIFP